MAERQILFVLGMHRSGTSALCAALESCGLSFGANLLDSMDGVNERGFWEDAGVVDLNERILERCKATWFDPPANVVEPSSAELADLAGELRQLLDQDYAESRSYAIKDPRLCVTLPLWLSACQGLNIATAVCVISRAPIEVAHSLQKRDEFPLGYGLRLYARYWRLLQSCVPAGALFLTYDGLLENVSASLEALAEQIDLSQLPVVTDDPVNRELRHFNSQPGDPLLTTPSGGTTHPEELEAAIEKSYPLPDMLSEMVRVIVRRGEKLTEVGSAHSEALRVVAERDNDVERVSRLHTEALATIANRDQQIAELNSQLAGNGAHLEKALATLNERDAQIRERDAQLREKVDELAVWDENLQRVLETPVLNRLFHRMWYREER
ncbi:MAG: hypothetical protein Hals2KO_30300 [Halioglobus sp.]